MTRRLQMTRPLVLLALVAMLSLAARAAWLGRPCRAPCRTAADHTLIFDEAYYVNAARVIAAISPPAGDHYAGSPFGEDPNSEHPQLAKLVMAGSIELFGDGPFAWRLPSLVLGTLAVLGMFALARAAGGGESVALAAAALLAADNLLIVHSRIATLDVYALTAMIWGTALYLRRSPVTGGALRSAIAGGALIGLGCSAKLVAPYALLTLLVFELLSGLERRGGVRGLGPAAARLGASIVAAGATFLGLLALFDRVAPPYDATAGRALAPGPFHHLAHMVSYAAGQTSPHGPQGIASYPWQWLMDYKPIVYLNINPGRSSSGLLGIRPAVHFLGMISPPVMLLALPALAFAAWRVWRRRHGALRDSSDVPIVALAWFLGTWLPFVGLSLFWSRTSYLYYMVIVLPGIYLAVAHLALQAVGRPRKLVALWAVAVVVAAVVMYPFTPLP